MKPSFVTKLNRADALVVQGPRARARVPAGAARGGAQLRRSCPARPRYIDASLYVKPLEVPDSQSRTQGELHPLGNPHFNLDPDAGEADGARDRRGARARRSRGRASYRDGLDALHERCSITKIAEWDKLAAPLRGVQAVSYHPDLIYLARTTTGSSSSARSRPSRACPRRRATSRS